MPGSVLSKAGTAVTADAGACTCICGNGLLRAENTHGLSARKRGGAAGGPDGNARHRTEQHRGKVTTPGPHPAHPSSPVNPGGERWPKFRLLASLIAQLVGLVPAICYLLHLFGFGSPSRGPPDAVCFRCHVRATPGVMDQSAPIKGAKRHTNANAMSGWLMLQSQPRANSLRMECLLAKSSDLTPFETTYARILSLLGAPPTHL